MTNCTPAIAEETFRKLLHTAREAWPAITVPEDAFAELLAVQATSGPGARAPSELPVAAMWLALGCARGDAEALRAFEASTFPGARVALRHMDLSPDTIAEVLQLLRERFLVAQPGKAPRILAAAAYGNLPGQIRLAAVRLAIDLYRRDHRVDLNDVPLARAVAASDDPELAVLNGQLRSAFTAAIEQALTCLTPKERNLLRMNFVHGLSIDEIGRSYQASRSTVARWLAGIRARINHESRRLMREQHGLCEAEVDSLLKLVDSRIHVSFLRLLGTGEK